MSDKLTALIEKKGIPLLAIAREIGIPYACLYEWKTGKSIPRADNLYKIAKYFGVSMESFFED